MYETLKSSLCYIITHIKVVACVALPLLQTVGDEVFAACGNLYKRRKRPFKQTHCHTHPTHVRMRSMLCLLEGHALTVQVFKKYRGAHVPGKRRRERPLQTPLQCQ